MADNELDDQMIQLQQSAFRKDKDNLDFLTEAGVGLETCDPAGDGVSWRVEGTKEWYDNPRSAIAAARFPKTPAKPVAKPEAAEGICGLCGKPMPPGEEMFRFHGYSGPCPKDAAVDAARDGSK